MKKKPKVGQTVKVGNVLGTIRKVYLVERAIDIILHDGRHIRMSGLSFN